MYLMKELLKVRIVPLKGGFSTIEALIPEEICFDITNTYESFTSPEGGRAQKLYGSFVSTESSLVPYSPNIYVGSEPVSMPSFELTFVGDSNPKAQVHDQLRMLRAISLPRKGGGGIEVGGNTFGTLVPPVPVQLIIADGKQVNWSPCYVRQMSTVERGPWYKGYGMIGKATVEVITEYHLTAESELRASNGGRVTSYNDRGGKVK